MTYMYMYIYICIYHKMQYMFKFYLEIFTWVPNVVSLCHEADVPSVSDFAPNPMNHLRIYS